MRKILAIFVLIVMSLMFATPAHAIECESPNICREVGTEGLAKIRVEMYMNKYKRVYCTSVQTGGGRERIINVWSGKRHVVKNYRQAPDTLRNCTLPKFYAESPNIRITTREDLPKPFPDLTGSKSFRLY